MSSAFLTNSERSPLLMTSRYRCTARRMSSTSVLHVSGTACVSSKKRRGTREDVDEAAGALANEFIVVPIGGIPCCICENDTLLPASVRLVLDRLKGDVALRESIEVAGETPSDKNDLLRRFCNIARQSVLPSVVWLLQDILRIHLHLSLSSLES